MSDKQYDSVLVGYAEEPRYNDEQRAHELEVRLKDTELQEMIEKYANTRNDRDRVATSTSPCSCPRTGSLAAVSSILTAQLPRRSVQQRQPRPKTEDDLPF